MKKGKITKRAALIKTSRLWYWLAGNPKQSKFQWIEWREKGGEEDSLYGCFACDYHETKHSDSLFCEPQCLLSGLWGKDGCIRSVTSPFKLWKESKEKDRIKYALQIAHYCDKLLKKKGNK